MQLTLSNVKAWARENDFSGYCGPRVIRDALIHDLTFRCASCAGVFTDADDGERTDGGWFCDDCDAPSGYFNPARHWGTHNHVRGL